MADKPPISSYDEPIDESGADEVVQRLQQNKDRSTATLPDAAKMALKMKGLGFSILPLPTNQRSAPIGTWDKAVNNNPAVFLTNPGTHNYAVLPPPGCFALDVDEGVPDLLVKVTASLATQLPVTLTTFTPDGQHLFFRWPGDLPKPDGKMFGEVVTRWPFGEKGQGYTVGPGSMAVSKVSGALKPYIPFGLDDDDPIADFPRAWAEAALRWKPPRPVAPPPGALAEVAGPHYELPESVKEGNRYDAVVRYTAHLYNRGFDVDEMLPLVENRLAPRFETQKPRAELVADFRRATKDMDVRLGEPKALPTLSSSAPLLPAPVPPEAEASVEDDVKPVEPALALTIADLVDELRAGDPTQWLIDGWLPANALMWFAGQPKSMKSLAVLQMLGAYVSGGEWMGRAALSNATRVAWYVTREGSRADMLARLEHIQSTHPGLGRRYRVSFLKPIEFDKNSLASIVAYLVDMESEYSMLAEPLQCAMVLDPLRDFMLAGWDENDAKVIAEVKRWARYLIDRFPWLTVVIVHHLRKSAGYDGGDGLDMSGSGAGYGAGDGTIMWSTKRDDVDDDDDMDDAADSGTLVELKPRYGRYKVEPRGGAIFKGKWMFQPMDKTFVRQRGAVMRNGRAEAGTRSRSLIDIIIAAGVAGITVAGLAEQAGSSTHTVRTSLNRLQGKGSVSSGVPAGQNVTHWYARGYAPSEHGGMLDEPDETSEAEVTFNDPLHALND